MTHVGPDAGQPDGGAITIIGIPLAIANLKLRRRGRSARDQQRRAVEGGHFAERFQAFIIIALRESVVVTGATTSASGLSTEIVIALTVAFLGTDVAPSR